MVNRSGRILLLVATLSALLGAPQLMAHLTGRCAARVRALLASDSAADRRAAATLVADGAAAQVADALASRLAREPDAGVRESYVHALGTTDDPGYFELLVRRASDDGDAYTRHSACVAAARCAPERFRAWLATATPPVSPWDKLGRAYAGVLAGDARHVPDLVDMVTSGPADVQRIARRYVLRGVAPLLDAVGQWPIAAPQDEADIWSRDVMDEIARGCATTHLQQVLDDLALLRARAAAVHHNAGKLLKARQRLAWLLGAEARPNE